MREIKFRAWDKTMNCMCFLNHPHWSLYSSFTGNMRVHNLQNGSGGDEYELMQYIGLKDINGVEIYEGDIVKVIYGKWENEKHGLTRSGYVIFENASFRVSIKDSAVKIGFYDVNKIETIGNIHQNPELLK